LQSYVCSVLAKTMTGPLPVASGNATETEDADEIL
jgi:hypothetical protein